MIVAIITETKALNIKGKQYSEGVLYNPINTPSGKWVVSLVEAQFMDLTDIVELTTTEIINSEESNTVDNTTI